jgi:hypothetical protein
VVPLSLSQVPRLTKVAADVAGKLATNDIAPLQLGICPEALPSVGECENGVVRSVNLWESGVRVVEGSDVLGKKGKDSVWIHDVCVHDKELQSPNVAAAITIVGNPHLAGDIGDKQAFSSRSLREIDGANR